MTYRNRLTIVNSAMVVYAAFILAVFSCCEASRTKNGKEPTVVKSETSGNRYTVEEIDGCEYLIRRYKKVDYSYSFMAHKGNCKYCEARRKAELQELKESIKEGKKSTKGEFDW